MTALVNRVSETLSAAELTRVDAVVVVVLLTILAEQEIARAYIGELAPERLRPLRVVVLPLLAAFVLIVSARVLGHR